MATQDPYRVRSMTGFGRAELVKDELRYLVEVRSLNHRFLDINLKLPKADWVFEGRIKRLVSERVKRGRVELHLQKDPSLEAPLGLVLDIVSTGGLVSLLTKLEKDFSLSGGISLDSLLNFRDVIFTKERRTEEPSEWIILNEVISSALDSLNEMKTAEGEAIARDFGCRLERMKQLIGQVRKRAGEVAEQAGDRLRAKLNVLLGDLEIDRGRLAQEVALLVVKSDINEELDRVDSHLCQFGRTLVNDSPLGRRLEFIIQEINREVSTLAAKVGDFPVSMAVVEMKVELEKLREQTQNLE